MWTYPQVYDVIVVGGGHAGVEAARAAALMGCRTLLLTTRLDAVGLMSCNPAIGGIGKGHLVREIHSLGGAMGTLADATAIQGRVLNRSKGPAVRGTRLQCDRDQYRRRTRRLLERVPRLELKQGEATAVATEGGGVTGIATHDVLYRGKAVVITPGTFLNGVLHYGLTREEGGRAGEGPARALAASLTALGIQLSRLKTGTPPRVRASSADITRCEVQTGDEPCPAFTRPCLRIRQLPCYITYTNERTAAVLRANLERSPLFQKVIQGVGPRYCPSIEDKVVRFERDRHQLFLEPEGKDVDELYINGFSSSMPPDVQEEALRTVAGLAGAQVTRYGYAVEYDYAPPSQLDASLQVRAIPGLFFAGQINGTSGYEEAAAQGLMAGINAALTVKGEPPFILRRDEAYIGVLIDDLITKEHAEPYRMFTSRAEYRLRLREDNAEDRLMGYGLALGLVAERRRRAYGDFLRQKGQLRAKLKQIKVKTEGGAVRGDEWLKRPEAVMADLTAKEKTLRGYDERARAAVEADIKYEGYARRQERDARALAEFEQWVIPPSIAADEVIGLSREARDVLRRYKPRTLGAAMRLQGVSPADGIVLLNHLKNRGGTGHD